VANATYELPIGKGRHFLNHHRVLDYLIGGYDLAWVQTIETGNPFGFSFTNSSNLYFPSSIGNYVPNLLCNGISMPQFGLDKIIDSGGNRFNQAVEGGVLNASCFGDGLLHAGKCGTQYRDRSGQRLLADLGVEELPLQGAVEHAAPLRLPEPVPQLGLQQPEQHRRLQESPTVRQDHLGPDYSVVRRRAADELDASAELVISPDCYPGGVGLNSVTGFW